MLTYSRHVIYRGKEIPLAKLKANSQKKIVITCPECGCIFERYFSVLRKSGCFLCQKCAIKEKLSKTLKQGTKKNKLTVLCEAERSGYSVFRCDCGVECELLNRHFLSGKTQSCGCLRRETMKRIGVHLSGKDHGRWKGGITGERQSEMTKAPYKTWRSSIYERDEYTCLKCGQIGGNLNAHHIYNYSDNKTKIIKIENGATLCRVCHDLFHKIYTRRNNTQEQLDEFLAAPHSIRLPRTYQKLQEAMA